MDREAVIPLITTEVLYEVPLLLEDVRVADYLIKRLKLEARRSPDLSDWQRLVVEVRKPKPYYKVALVGKYVELHDAYMSVREALKHAALSVGIEVEILWIHSSELEKGRGWDEIYQADGVIVPGGFGSRGTEGKIKAIHYAREQRVPYLGLCLGMQLMVVELGRHVLNNDEVNSTEFDRSTPYPVIDLMPDQRSISDMGGFIPASYSRVQKLPKLMVSISLRNGIAIASS